VAYCTVVDIEAQTGYSNADFISGGTRMTAEQWTDYVTLLIASASAWIDTFCRRSFILKDYVELRDGQGVLGPIYRPHQQPVVTITEVAEDVTLTGAPTWTVRTARSALVAGDYRVLEQNGITSVVFTNNLPRCGTGNVRITYSAGFAETSGIYLHVRDICKQIVENALMRKKKLQESTAARNGPTKDAAEMIPVGDPKVVTDWIKDQLKPYVRNTVRRS
jgi:hypothetical protein